ncbi:hypothetical protein EV284_6485 [Streptomyces sp. BK022]|uniref:hypothetical protein n=1 Tax=Streptomyces sp. BK022 TaxID=2512123 RepID=UPI001029D0C1|nr:hypothetical protein [Streptomyces sp. BK022]RZU28319.1 hypothetical protein EV284_6485 [Streptomyces sp. BK022]
MTRYGFAIKALPKGAKPFGEEEDDKKPDGTSELTQPDAGTGPAEPEPTPATDNPFADPGTEQPDPAADETSDGGQEPAETEAETPPDAPADDARPWAGDEYSAGDESDPADAFSAYTGSNGEQAWLDRDTDGTLTGWVRDSTGQVWRYTDPDAWADDVDGAQMTQTHSQANGDTTSQQPDSATAPQAGVQDSMFQGS